MPDLRKIESESSEVRRGIERIRRLSGEYLEYRKMMASIQKQTFDAYVDAGFTEAQALELTKDL